MSFRLSILCRPFAPGPCPAFHFGSSGETFRAAEVSMSWQVPGYRHRLDLGGGVTGRVVLALNEDSGELVAVKYLHVEAEFLDQVREEVATVATLDQQHFVRIREFVESRDGQ